MTEIDRRQALRLLSRATPVVAAGVFGLPGYHPAVPAQEADRVWRPRRLTEDDVALVAELCERIIPETDSPGARGALVHQYVDYVALRERDWAERLSDALEVVRREASGHGGFLRLDVAARDALLRRLSEADDATDERSAFDSLRSLTIRGYYRSRVGMHEELGYDGNKHLSRFEGCTHDEHLRWEPDPERIALVDLARGGREGD